MMSSPSSILRECVGSEPETEKYGVGARKMVGDAGYEYKMVGKNQLKKWAIGDRRRTVGR